MDRLSNRSDNWTKKDDEILIEEMKKALVEGYTRTYSFEVAGGILKRTPESVSFRYYSELFLEHSGDMHDCYIVGRSKRLQFRREQPRRIPKKVGKELKEQIEANFEADMESLYNNRPEGQLSIVKDEPNKVDESINNLLEIIGSNQVLQIKIDELNQSLFVEKERYTELENKHQKVLDVLKMVGFASPEITDSEEGKKEDE